jgi:hypothetical protein
MPLLALVIILLIAVGIGALVGSVSTVVVGALIGIAAAIALLAGAGAVAAWRHPAHRDDGAPARTSRI